MTGATYVLKVFCSKFASVLACRCRSGRSGSDLLRFKNSRVGGSVVSALKV